MGEEGPETIDVTEFFSQETTVWMFAVPGVSHHLVVPVFYLVFVVAFFDVLKEKGIDEKSFVFLFNDVLCDACMGSSK